MTDSELTVSILREIRDEIRSTNTRLDTTNVRLDSIETNVSSRIDQTNVRLDVTNARLGVVEHTLHDLAAQQLIVSRYIKNVAVRHDDALDNLRVRVEKLEATPK